MFSKPGGIDLAECMDLSAFGLNKTLTMQRFGFSEQEKRVEDYQEQEVNLFKQQ